MDGVNKRKHELVVPNTANYKDWFDFTNSSLNFSNQKINLLIVDFNSISFMTTTDFVILACIIENFYLNGCTDIRFINGSKALQSHISNIRFAEYWEKNFNRESFTISRNNTTLCLWKISKNMSYSYSKYAKNYFEKYLKNRDLLPLASNMDEIFNNIFDHSNSNVSGYIITQFYPKKNKLSFSVCDFGIGIPIAINSYLDEKKEDWEAIAYALKKGVSSRSTPRNRGFGLDNLRELTESSNGRLTIISNNGYLSKKAGELFKMGNYNYNFKGTLLNVELDLNTFEKKDNSEQFFDF